MHLSILFFFFFFFNDTATTEIYTLSLHDALPISNSSIACASRNEAMIPPPPINQISLPGCARRRLTYGRSEEHTSELQSQSNLVCRLLLEKKKNTAKRITHIRKYTQVRFTDLAVM